MSPDRWTSEGWVLERGSSGYPDVLETSVRPPERLFGIGDASLLTAGLAIVGSRRSTPYGRSCARRFAGWAAENGICVVSGAARGCDAEAHRAALETEGPTVAVLGCGPDVDYPPDEARLLRRLRRKACVVAEVPFGTRPTRWSFPQRNRIIAALSSAVLVVEATVPSGTFSTADHALASGRDVLAVPGSVFAEGSAGTNRLIRQGAQPITCEEDLSDALSALGIPSRRSESESASVDSHDDELAAAVLADPMTADELARALALPVPRVLEQLAVLQEQGLVARYPNGRYGPC